MRFEKFLNEKSDILKFSDTDSLSNELLSIVPWLSLCDVKDIEIILIDKKINWLKGWFLNGVWEDGIWESGSWLDGEWKAGIFKSGVWRRGIFSGGKFLEGGYWESGSFKQGTFSGIWESGFFEDGIFQNGTWLGGSWESGIWKSGRWKTGSIFSEKFNQSFESYLNPLEFRKLEEQSESSVNLIKALEDGLK